MLEKAVGSDHPAVAVVLTHLATVYGKMGQPEDAKRLKARAAKIEELQR